MIEPLSAAEARVAKMVAWGLSNREIADALVLSSNTIKTHVSAALGKLQMRNRTELAVFMAKHRMEVQGE